MRKLFGCLTAFLLAACSGGGARVSSADILSSSITVNECACEIYGSFGDTLTVSPTYSATLTYLTTPPQSYSLTLPRSLAAKLYNDLAAAQPLSSLPQTSAGYAFVGSLTISVVGQTTPNIYLESGIGGTLNTDVNNIYKAFPTPTPTSSPT
jgi:hypothetical protein